MGLAWDIRPSFAQEPAGAKPARSAAPGRRRPTVRPASPADMQYNPFLFCRARDRLTLRLVVYNIRYATGTGPAFHLPVPGAGYLRSNRKILAGITDFL